ncbi:MAG: hypothetical protein ACRDKG_16030 [Actinomycetota bacterium]
MVKSTSDAMTPKRRSKADLELLKELEDLDRRMRESDLRIGATLEKIRVAREKLRPIIEAKPSA